MAQAFHLEWCDPPPPPSPTQRKRLASEAESREHTTSNEPVNNDRQLLCSHPWLKEVLGARIEPHPAFNEEQNRYNTVHASSTSSTRHNPYPHTLSPFLMAHPPMHRNLGAEVRKETKEYIWSLHAKMAKRTQHHYENGIFGDDTNHVRFDTMFRVEVRRKCDMEMTRTTVRWRFVRPPLTKSSQDTHNFC
jgi:hypothetical protein